MAVTANINDDIAEEGSVGFTLTFTDEDGASMVPSTVTWTLTDDAGNIINSRDGVSATPGSTMTITLSGDDLAVGTNGVRRQLLVEYTYTSDLGTDLPGKYQVGFSITNLVHVT